MQPPAPCTPADQLSAIIGQLITTLDSHSMWRWGKLARPLAVLISSRLIAICQLFCRTAERVAAGTYRPRRHSQPRRSSDARPRKPDPLPRGPAWLLKLLQETATGGSQLGYLFRDPAMIALMQAAPTTLRRPLRSLCRMLGVIPPPVLAPPQRKRPASDPPAAPTGRLRSPPRRRPEPPPRADEPVPPLAAAAARDPPLLQSP